MNALRRARLDAGLTQQQLADRAGVGLGSVGALEGSFGEPWGKIYTPARLAILAALGMDPTDYEPPPSLREFEVAEARGHRVGTKAP